MPFDPISQSYPEPFRGEPVDLPVERDRDRDESARVRVHTELGVPIYFAPATRKFSAKLSPVSGRGAAMELVSLDFDAILTRIRQRALVVPVQAYKITIESHADQDEDVVQVVPVTVIEHHARRLDPYVARYTEPDRRTGQPLARIRALRSVYLPRPEHLARLRAAHQAIREAARTYATLQTRLHAEASAALSLVPQLGSDQVRYIQETEQQMAERPDGLGAIVFESEADAEDEEVQDGRDDELQERGA